MPNTAIASLFPVISITYSHEITLQRVCVCVCVCVCVY